MTTVTFTCVWNSSKGQTQLHPRTKDYDSCDSDRPNIPTKEGSHSQLSELGQWTLESVLIHGPVNCTNEGHRGYLLVHSLVNCGDGGIKGFCPTS